MNVRESAGYIDSPKDKYTDGSSKKLVIDSSKVGCYKIFKVKGIVEDFIILDEDIVALLTGANAMGLNPSDAIVDFLSLAAFLLIHGSFLAT